MPSLTYLCGPPGAGKSTLMAALTARCDIVPASAGVPHAVLIREGHPVGAEIGRRRPAFPGTDALSMSIAPAARAWIATVPYRLVLGEGRRLASLSFLQAAAEAGYSVTLVHLDATPEALAERRAARGSNQAGAWARGTATAAAGLADAAAAAGYNVRRLDSTAASPGQLAAELAAEADMEVLGVATPGPVLL